MILEEMYIVLWAIFVGGIYYSFKKHGENQYNEGMSSAICMHHTGELQYRIVKNKTGKEEIQIKVKGG
jgi:hypothetical protein